MVEYLIREGWVSRTCMVRSGKVRQIDVSCLHLIYMYMIITDMTWLFLTSHALPVLFLIHMWIFWFIWYFRFPYWAFFFTLLYLSTLTMLYFHEVSSLKQQVSVYLLFDVNFQIDGGQQRPTYSFTGQVADFTINSQTYVHSSDNFRLEHITRRHSSFCWLIFCSCFNFSSVYIRLMKKKHRLKNRNSIQDNIKIKYTEMFKLSPLRKV